MALILLLFSTAVRSGNYEVDASAALRPDALHDLFSDLKRAERVTTDFFKGKPPRLVRIVVCPTTYDFCALTGLAYWRSARTVDSTIYLQPLRVLADRQITRTTISHEFVHLMLRGRRPALWLEEGLAVYLSGEIKNLAASTGSRIESDPLRIANLLRSSNPDSAKQGYLSAYMKTRKIIDASGRDGIIKIINHT